MFLVIALSAGLFGYFGVGVIAWEGARIYFFIFLVLGGLRGASGDGGNAHRV